MNSWLRLAIITEECWIETLRLDIKALEGSIFSGNSYKKRLKFHELKLRILLWLKHKLHK